MRVGVSSHWSPMPATAFNGRQVKLLGSRR
jgi:hypothetical protein